MRTQVTSFLEDYVDARYWLFKSRVRAGILAKIILCVTMATITGLSAQLRIPLPWSPVPITGQTFSVLLAGVLLGRWWGGASMALYVGLGVMGVPWFNGWKGGVSHLLGPTGGYILGFILASLFLGYVTDRRVKARNFIPMLLLMLFSNFILIYVPGLIQLGLWLSLVRKAAVTLPKLLQMGAIPFIAGDAIKATLAALVAKGVTPKTAYTNEVDAAK